MLYTKKGDKGTSGLFCSSPSEHISKTDTVFEALGEIDQLNSLLGLCRAYNKSTYIKIGKKKISVAEIVRAAQDTLFVIQAELAGAPKRVKKSVLDEAEKLIDDMEKEMPPIKSFKLSGESKESAWFDYARAVTRHAERKVLIHAKAHPKAVSDTTRQYLNRLSSLLYACARVITFQKGVKEYPPTYKTSEYR
ncbi:MAG: cob(I)yrinic acid a,c-diamide adenosyltransferase [Candidatus Pacebacteria bacterium]|nr:cob(I)yrinic acid a,c-diamide adenosyltransferase [Candidatus Paceibacterota bacterium]